MKGHACLHVFRYVCPAFGESLLVLSFESDELRPDSASLSAAAWRQEKHAVVNTHTKKRP